MFFSDEPTSFDKSIYDALKSFNLLTEVTPEKYPCLYSWYMLVGRFQGLVAIAWRIPEEGQEKKGSKVTDEAIVIVQTVLDSLKKESEKEADERREKQKWENYVPAGDKRPLDEFHNLTSIESECVIPPEDITQDKDE